MSQLFNLQKYTAQDYNGLVTDNHLNALYMQKPELISKVIKEIFKVNLQNEYMSFVNKFPTKTVQAENNFYEWMLQGQHERNIGLVEYYDTTGASPAAVGANVSRFFMVFPEQYFEPDNIIVGEREDYHIRIVSHRPKGVNTEYEVELLTDDITLSVPAEELFAGSRWSKDYNLSPSTLSSRGAKPNLTSPFRMRNRPCMMRMEYEVPGNMINKGSNEPLEFAFKYEGKEHKMWINYQDMVALHQFNQQMARACLYGKKNWTNDNLFFNKDEAGKFNLESGAGLFEQIAPGNIHYYNAYDLDWHVSMLVDMGVGKIERGRRKITIMTGEFGMIQAHNAIEARSAQWTPNFDQSRFFSGKGDGISMAKGYGGQFTEYKSVNGIDLRFEIMPFFDDDIRFKTYHPDGGVTESYRMIAFDYGGDAGIYKINPAGTSSVWAYKAGLRDPFTPGGKGQPKQINSSIDGYEVHRADWGGLMVEDPTKIVDLRYNFVRS